MRDQDVITRLVELHDHIQAPATPPRLDALRGERIVRRRTVSALAAAAVVVLSVGIAQASLSDGQRTQEPAPQPSPSQTESPSTVEEWTPERIRDEGSGEEILTTASGLAAAKYVVCDGPGCNDTNSGQTEDLHVALQVTQDGRSALFDVLGGEAWVNEFDEDSLLVQDDAIAPRVDEARARLLQADGTAVELRRLDDPATAVPGPGVVVIDRSNGILAGAEDLYLVDDLAGTIQPLDAPKEVRYWGPNVDEFLWGITDDCRVFWATAGTFEERQLDCPEGLDFTAAADYDAFPDGWLRPGRMVVEELSDPGNRTFVHVSIDSGATWQRMPIEDGETVADVLQMLG